MYGRITGQSSYGHPDSSATMQRLEPAAASIMAIADGPWQRTMDQTTMQPYYYNTRTQESTYVRPPEFRTPPDGPYSTTGHDFQMTASPVKAAIDNSPWQKTVDPNTQFPYYYNNATQESTYQRPRNFHTPPDEQPQAPPAPIMAITNTPWQKAIDQATMQPYYYNHATKESTYQRPVDYQTPPDPPTLAGQTIVVPSTTSYYSSTSSSSAGYQYDQQLIPAGGQSGPWNEYWDETYNVPYYFNNVTNETTYERPASMPIV